MRTLFGAVAMAIGAATANGQPLVEAGFSVGVSKVKATASLPGIRVEAFDGFSGAFGCDINIGRKKPVFFSAGIRALLRTYTSKMSADTTSVFSYVRNHQEIEFALPMLGLQWRTPIGKGVQLRTGAFVGPGIVYDIEGNQTRVVTEYAAGLLFNDRATLGARLSLPLAPYRENVFTYSSVAYKSMSLMGDLRVSLQRPDRTSMERMRARRPNGEIGVSIGPAIAYEVAHELQSDEVGNGLMLRFESDFHFDRREPRVYPYFGLRGGFIINGTAMMGIAGAIVGLQWAQPLNDELKLRVGAGAAPSAGLYFLIDGAYANIAAEGNLGFVFNNNLMAGFRFVQPFGDFYTYSQRVEAYAGSIYRIWVPMLEFRIRPGAMD